MAKNTINPTPLKVTPVASMQSRTGQGPYSLSNLITVVSNNFTIFFLMGLCFLGGFFGGSLWTENQLLRSGKTGTANVAAQPAAPAAADPSGPTADQLTKARAIDPKVDHVRGNADAKITLIEYSDFECPFCASFHPTMLQVMKEYGDDVRWVYRHYPLSFHPQAQKAAETSECVAKLKGKDAFWEFSDKIFAENTKLAGSLTAESAQTIAVAMGVDATALKTCVDSGEMAAKVKADMTDGTGAGISGTPGTIILAADGQAELIPGAVSFDQVKTMLDKYL